MDSDKSKQSDKPELDTIGMWFSAAVLLTVLVAGIIIYSDIYSSANDDIRMTVSNLIPTPASSLR